MKFKPGEKIRCIKNKWVSTVNNLASYNCAPVYGGIYTVKNYEGDTHLTVNEIPVVQNKVRQYWIESAFVKAIEGETEMIIRATQKLKEQISETILN